MGSASFNCSAGPASRAISCLERPAVASCYTSNSSQFKGLVFGKLSSSSTRQIGVAISCSKTTEITLPSNGPLNGSPMVPKEKLVSKSTTFPDAFKTLVTEVCDETTVAELKVKVGNYEMHLKRNIGATKASTPISSPVDVVSPSIKKEPSDKSAKRSSASKKRTPEKSNPFVKATKKSLKLAALEASGSSGYKLVSSPAVGSFHSEGSLKGSKEVLSECEEGDIVIKEGQIIGYIDQFGTKLPVKSDVGGELLKILVDDGDAVGYGDPIIAVVP